MMQRVTQACRKSSFDRRPNLLARAEVVVQPTHPALQETGAIRFNWNYNRPSRSQGARFSASAKEVLMFDSLDEQMKKDRDRQSTPKQRALLYLGVAVASILLFGGLVMGVRYMQP